MPPKNFPEQSSKTIEDLKLNNWTFTYIGTEHEVEKFAASISINNTINFNKNEADMHNMFLNESHARWIRVAKSE